MLQDEHKNDASRCLMSPLVAYVIVALESVLVTLKKIGVCYVVGQKIIRLRLFNKAKLAAGDALNVKTSD